MNSLEFLNKDVSFLKGIGNKTSSILKKKNINKISDILWDFPRETIDNISPFMPRKIKKEQFMISHFGLGFVTHANLLRDGSLGLNKKVCMYPVSDFINTLEVRSEETLTSVAPIIEQYWEK